MAADNKDEFEDDIESFDDSVEDDDQQAEEPGADEDWDSYDDQQGEESAPENSEGASAPKKKSSGLLIVVAAVVVLAGGGFFALKTMSKGAPVPSAPGSPVESASPAPAAPEQTASSQAPKEVVAPEPQGGLLGNPQAVARLQQDIKHSAAATESAHAELPKPKETSESPPPPMPTPISSQAETVSPAAVDAGSVHMPKAADVMIKQQPVEPVQAINQNPVPAPAPIQPVTAKEAPLLADNSQLVAKMDEILSRLGHLESDVKTLQEKTNQTAPKESDTALAGQVEELKASVASLEKKMTDESGGRPGPAVPLVEKPVERPVSHAEEPAKPIAKAKESPKILGSADGAETSLPQASAAPKIVKQSKAWILKGAQPGRAMVSRAGESDIKTVEVGDTLPGIGKVTSIEYRDGRWTVSGTQGKIIQ